MKNLKAKQSQKKEARTRLNSKLVKKFGFEQKFLIKEVLDSVLEAAQAHEFSSLKMLGLRSEAEIKKRLVAKQSAMSQKKKMNLLNSSANPRNAAHAQAKGQKGQVQAQVCAHERIQQKGVPEETVPEGAAAAHPDAAPAPRGRAWFWALLHPAAPRNGRDRYRDP